MASNTTINPTINPTINATINLNFAGNDNSGKCVWVVDETSTPKLPMRDGTDSTGLLAHTNDTAFQLNSSQPSMGLKLIVKSFPCDRKNADISSFRQLLEKLIKIKTLSAETYNFYFPGVSDTIASLYWDILMSMERRFAIDDYFTNPELRKIVNAIDNHDYVKDAYPDTNVGWNGLLIDIGVFRAIGRFKKQYENPLLVSVERVCTALTTPMPKHLYYLKFRFADDSMQIFSYCSGDEILYTVHIEL
jgi:hypothetical protein